MVFISKGKTTCFGLSSGSDNFLLKEINNTTRLYLPVNGVLA